MFNLIINDGNDSLRYQYDNIGKATEMAGAIQILFPNLSMAIVDENGGIVFTY